MNRLKGSSIKGYQKISSQNSLGRTTVKPVSSSLANAVMPKTKNNINGTAQIDKRRSSEPIELNGKNNIYFRKIRSLFIYSFPFYNCLL